MTLMEEWGSGYKRICDFCNDYGYPVPEWLETGPVVRVIVYPHPEATESLPHVTPHVAKLLPFCEKPTGREELQKHIGVKDRKYFHKVFLNPALQTGLITHTIPEKPKSKLQQYRLTESGRQWLEKQNHQGL